MDHHQPASRYQVLHNEDDPPESTVEEPSTSTETAQNSQPAALSEADVSPPPYCSIAVEAAATSETPNEFYPVPPPYSVATSLPTYDEAEKAKAAAMAAAAAEAAQRHGQFRESRSLFDEIFLSPPEEEEYPPRDDFSDADQLRVGNDGIFMLAFFNVKQYLLLRKSKYVVFFSVTSENGVKTNLHLSQIGLNKSSVGNLRNIKIIWWTAS
ncbi:NEDD4 family-interacting protein 2 isoform X3 [Chelonia mydas]|uniref:NEDD4 family-interacting protein 2 isoform X3 n=1 Tax=Chelonia mydas TaxID=8469 RepID=UPI001CA82B40|nr:NEDD4 family-interacting protein 2 isoform X3 [Chelonia mydas]